MEIRASLLPYREKNVVAQVFDEGEPRISLGKLILTDDFPDNIGIDRPGAEMNYRLDQVARVVYPDQNSRVIYENLELVEEWERKASTLSRIKKERLENSIRANKISTYRLA